MSDPITNLPTTPPLAIAEKQWWKLLVLLLSSGLMIAVTLGMIPASKVEPITQAVLGIVIAAAAVVSNGWAFVKYLGIVGDAVSYEQATRGEMVAQEGEIRLENIRMQTASLNTEAMRLETQKFMAMQAAPIYNFPPPTLQTPPDWRPGTLEAGQTTLPGQPLAGDPRSFDGR